MTRFILMTVTALLIVIAIIIIVKATTSLNKNETWIIKQPIAHRGYFDNEKQIPENSLLAFEKAMENNFAIELDVHLSKDGIPIVHHDASVLRMCGEDILIHEAASQDLLEQKLLNTNQKIVTLDQTLRFVSGRVPLYIEIKHQPEGQTGLEDAVINALQGYEGPVIIISFNPKAIRHIKDNAPHLLRGLNLYPDMYTFTDILTTWPKCIVYDHNKISAKLIKALGHFIPTISYKVHSVQDLREAAKTSHNVIFEKLARDELSY